LRESKALRHDRHLSLANQFGEHQKEGHVEAAKLSEFDIRHERDSLYSWQ
jgi:hypothetical protein